MDESETTESLLREMRDILVQQNEMHEKHLERQRELYVEQVKLARQSDPKLFLLFFFFLFLTVTGAILLAARWSRTEQVGTEQLKSYLFSNGETVDFDRHGNVITFAAHPLLQTKPGMGVESVDQGLADATTHDIWKNLEFRDKDLKKISSFRHVTRLELYNTGITDAGLNQVAKFAHLRHLDLYSTRVTDSGIQHLLSLSELEYLDLRKTAVSRKGIELLCRRLPYCEIVSAEQPIAPDKIESEETL